MDDLLVRDFMPSFMRRCPLFIETNQNSRKLFWLLIGLPGLRLIMWVTSSIVCFIVGILRVGADCNTLQSCNGHGTCTTTTQTCSCYDGWGATDDVSYYKQSDCSVRVCPSGKAWGDVPTSTTAAHAVAECSNGGLCDRCTGLCTCFTGFTGGACERTSCPNDCSGHGSCVSMKRLATLSDALPLSAATTYTGAESTTTWDEEKVYGCVCDSSWTVGLASGETQEPEYFGADCSLRHCPTGNDPMTDADETDCGSTAAAGGYGTGASGNLCHVDCANRGLCDYTTGTCKCFSGYSGENCATKDAYIAS